MRMVIIVNGIGYVRIKEGIMKQLILDWLIAIGLVVICSIEVEAQDLRELLTDEFQNRQTWFTYSENGQTITEPYITRFGRLKRDYTAPFLQQSQFAPGSGPLDIPNAALAAEHWWMSFEILMKAQREYADCVGAINENLRRLGQKCMLDQPCHPLYELVMVIREYWVPFNIVEQVGYNTPPRREDYVAHFEAGIMSVNQAVYHTNLCKQTLNWIRTVKR